MRGEVQNQRLQASAAEVSRPLKAERQVGAKIPRYEGEAQTYVQQRETELLNSGKEAFSFPPGFE